MPSRISYPVHCCEHDSGTLWLVQRCSWYQSRGLFKTRMGVRVDLCQHSCWELAQFHDVWGSPGALPLPVWGTWIQLRDSAGSVKLGNHTIGTRSLFHNKLYVKNEKKKKKGQIFLPFSAAAVLPWKTISAPQGWRNAEELGIDSKRAGLQAPSGSLLNSSNNLETEGTD